MSVNDEEKSYLEANIAAHLVQFIVRDVISRCKCYKAFCLRNWRCVKKARVLVTDKIMQTSHIFTSCSTRRLLN